MKKTIEVILLFLLCTLTVFPDTVRQRFALVVSSKKGAGKPTLQYADKDAEIVAEILKEMGGVREDNIIILPSVSIKKLKKGFEDMEKLLRKIRKNNGIQTEILFYYSGHSDQYNLLLGNSKYPYSRLKEDIKNLECNMTFVILDCCNSGGFITAKGGSFSPPFLIDEANKYHGYIYLTSSREMEESYESETIGGSLYTSALVSGLRGAADTDCDGNVTLNEISDFVDQETRRLAGKENTSIQKPVFKTDLEQSGKIVMTDINKTSSRILFKENIEGAIVIIDMSRNLTWELSKNAGTTRQIGLAAGDYQVKINYRNHFYSVDFKLKKGETRSLASLKGMTVSREVVLPAKGKSPGFYSVISIGAGPVIPLGETGEYTGIGISPAVTYYLIFPYKNIEWGIGFTTGVQYEESVEKDPDELHYSLYNAPGALCVKMTLLPPHFLMDFYMEVSAGIVGIYQDFNNKNIENAIGTRFIGTGCIGTGIPLSRHFRAGGYWRLTVIPFDDNYIYTNCTPGLFIDFNLIK